MRWSLILRVGLILAAVLSLSAIAQDVALTVWDLPFAEAFPAGIALGEDGTVFVAANGGVEVLGLDAVNGFFHSWGVGDRPEDVTVADGIPFCSVRGGNNVSYFDSGGLATNTAVVPFPNAGPGEIHRGLDTSDGRWTFWMTERDAGGILRFLYNPATDAPTAAGNQFDQAVTAKAVDVTPVAVTAQYERFSYDVTAIPDPNPILLASTQTSYPFTEWLFDLDDYQVTDLAVAGDGTLWISFGSPFLLRFDPAAETIQLLETIQNVMIFQGLLPDSDGSIWFGNLVDGSIGHFHPGTGLSEVWKIPGNIEVYDLVFDAAGAIWYTDRVGEAIGHFDPTTGEATIYPLPVDSEPLYLVIDDAGAVWFSAGSGNYIGRLVVGDSTDVSL